MFSSDASTSNAKQLDTNGHHSLNRSEQTSLKPLKSETHTVSSPPSTDDNTPLNENKSSKTKKINYTQVESKKISSPKKTELPDDDVPILMPKQHKPMSKSSITQKREEELVQAEHYQLPPKDENEANDDDEYRPPLPPKQRQQNNTSRALVYDFIGNELQELRATLAQFDGNASSMFMTYFESSLHFSLSL